MTILTFPRHSRPAERIEARIAALHRNLASMYLVNALLAADDVEGLHALGYTDSQITALNIPDSLGCRGFSERSMDRITGTILELERGLRVPPTTVGAGLDGRAS